MKALLAKEGCKVSTYASERGKNSSRQNMRAARGEMLWHLRDAEWCIKRKEVTPPHLSEMWRCCGEEEEEENASSFHEISQLKTVNELLLNAALMHRLSFHGTLLFFFFLHCCSIFFAINFACFTFAQFAQVENNFRKEDGMESM